MTYAQFVKAVSDAYELDAIGKPHKYYYFMLKKADMSTQAEFVYNDLQFLSPLQTKRDPRFGDLFVRDFVIAKEHGLRCRLGMKGIIVEGHVDGGLNHIYMIRETKRYVISPPSACKCQGLITTGQSARQTSYNWSDTATLPEEARNCPATEVALTAGEVLYLPSFWYHHIVSFLSSNATCARVSPFEITRSNFYQIAVLVDSKKKLH
ncbi:hypothetical protein V7S43_005407 [Phytophthora oleae]|uniref:Cupin-like domain-containing protein n=1 Tax=Phytophthora oleae TaxID=2107226 RepID=A0ABD3FSX2_9STRA